MAIMSHLSDAQALPTASAVDRINFAKHLLQKFPNTEIYRTSAELDEIYNDFKNR